MFKVNQAGGPRRSGLAEDDGDDVEGSQRRRDCTDEPDESGEQTWNGSVGISSSSVLLIACVLGLAEMCTEGLMYN